MATEVKNGEAFAKFVEEMKKINGAYVAIGLYEESGEYKDGMSVVEVGLATEFGKDNVPEFGWMRQTIDENMGKINDTRDDCLGKIHEGTMTVAQSLNKLGFLIQVLLQNKIKSNMPPENSDSTQKRKIREGVAPRTLIETGLMLRSVTYRVYGV